MINPLTRDLTEACMQDENLRRLCSLVFPAGEDKDPRQTKPLERHACKLSDYMRRRRPRIEAFGSMQENATGITCAKTAHPESRILYGNAFVSSRIGLAPICTEAPFSVVTLPATSRYSIYPPAGTVNVVVGQLAAVQS